jgi:hypothetical protein
MKNAHHNNADDPKAKASQLMGMAGELGSNPAIPQHTQNRKYCWCQSHKKNGLIYFLIYLFIYGFVNNISSSVYLALKDSIIELLVAN